MLMKPEALVTLENAGIFRAGRWLVRGVSMSVQLVKSSR
jgi:zinc transport system ATP-binding protein